MPAGGHEWTDERHVDQEGRSWELVCIRCGTRARREPGLGPDSYAYRKPDSRESFRDCDGAVVRSVMGS